MTGWSRPRALEVIATGLPILVQDEGRRGLAAVGVGRSGAADRTSYRQANRLVANRPGLAGLEITLGAARLRVRGESTVALTGAPAPMTVDGRAVPHATAVPVRHGQIIEIGSATAGLRCYLAVSGGVAVAPVLGSRSFDTLSGVGPAGLRPGDRAPVGEVDAEPPAGDAGAGHPAPPVPDPADDAFTGEAPTPIGSGALTLRVIPGPRQDWLDNLDTLLGSWRVSTDSDRVGMRLEGPALRRHPDVDGLELPSEGVVRGSIQVPAGGQPVVFGADHPVTGGYPVVAVLTEAACDQAAQARPGQTIRFVT